MFLFSPNFFIIFVSKSTLYLNIMAAKKDANPKDTPQTGFFSSIRAFLRNERIHFITGIFFVLFAAYTFISFLSFFYTGTADQSKIENLPVVELSRIENEILNWGGAFGAYLSDLFINRWIGISSFVVSLWLAVIGLKLMQVNRCNLPKLTLYCSLTIIISSLFFGYFFIDNYNDSFLFLGGYHGYYATLFLEHNIGEVGTPLLIMALTLFFLIIISKKTIDIIRRIFTLKISSKETIKPILNEPVTDPVPEKNIDQAEQKNNVTKKEIKEYAAHTPSPELTFDDEEAPYSDDTEDEIPFEVSTGETDGNDIPAPPLKELTIAGENGFTIAQGTEELTDNNAPLENYDPTRDLSHYKAPGFDLLNKYESSSEINQEELIANKKRITETLENYGIHIVSIKATVGPTITLYEIVPEAGIRIAKIKNLEDDIAMSLSALGIRIIAPIPGKGTIGIEVPNNVPQTVSMYSIIASRKFQECNYELPIALGKTITNDVYVADLCKMPHVLVAGATGQGKSVGLNAIISSLLYKKHPSQLKFVLVDPKKVEFSLYSAIERHFLAKLPDTEDAIITDVTKVVQTLSSITKEMDDRYDLLKKARVRTIKEYNTKFINRGLNPNNGHHYMPYIVVIIDEFSDLIMTAGKEVEAPIIRIAQLARAVGIHMIIATQRPSTNVITGIIKANFPTRIAFRVMSMIDSRTILDCPGANQLIGRGDMLIFKGSELERVQCAFIDTPEVERLCEYISQQQGYPTAFMLPEYTGGDSEGGAIDFSETRERDPLFDEAARMIVVSQQASTSSLQRRYSIGYNRAGRLMDQLEAAGIVGPSEGGKPRQVLVMDIMQLENKLS